MYPSIKKTVFAMLTLVCIGPLKAETQYETITIAKGHFAQRQFSEGRGVLLGRLRAPDVSVDEKSSILTAFADFTAMTSAITPRGWITMTKPSV